MISKRYELKFPISLAVKKQILERFQHALVQDKNGLNACYRVSSQYFDSPDLTAYREKLDGERVRKKYRLRYYTRGEGEHVEISAAFMEIKHRINNTVYKERVRLRIEGAEAILADSRQLRQIHEHVVDEDQEKKATMESIFRAASVPGFSRVNVITYMREAWEGEIDSRLRITYDTKCRVLLPEQYFLVGSSTGRLIIPGEQTLMEVKFNHAIPRWVRDVIGKFGISLRRFSKYAAGVEGMRLTHGSLPATQRKLRTPHPFQRIDAAHQFHPTVIDATQTSRRSSPSFNSDLQHK